jgi:GGDEF domain-containing protein
MYGPVLDDRGREAVDWIVKSAARLDSLIDDLLAYTRVGPSEQVDAAVDLGAVMEDVAVSLEGTLADVTWDELPEVMGDPVQLNQLLLNLVSNGCKFVPEGTRPRVHVSAERRPDGWCITVADNGIGIEPQSREQIFQMFKRLHRRDAYDGTGIGLAISKRIVEGRGGAVWVEDGPEGGSRFRFTIPDRRGPDRIGRAAGSPGDAARPHPEVEPATQTVPEESLLLRLARDLRHASLTGDRVSVFCVRLDALPDAPGTDDIMRELGFRLKRAVRPQDTVERTDVTQFTVVCTAMSSPQDIVTVRSRLARAAANAGAAVFIGDASGTGEDAPEELLRQACYGSNR